MGKYKTKTRFEIRIGAMPNSRLDTKGIFCLCVVSLILSLENKVDWNVYLTGENGLTTHCNQIESCGVFLVNGDTLAQINLDHVSNFKEVKNVMPFFKNKPTINHEEFHYFDFNGSKCRLDRVERKVILRAEIDDSDVPLVFYKTKYGMVLCAIGNEESADTDSGEKVATAVTRIGNFLEMCGY